MGSRRRGPVVLCVMDGIGLGGGGEDDAVATSRTPHLDALMGAHPWCKLKAHGTAVGLPSDDDMGNSEVGHNAMGAGRVFDQGAALVDQAIATGRIWESDTWRALTRGRTLHLIGLVSDGNVHSNITHLRAVIERAAVDGVRRLRVHVLTDGRDVPARSALTWVEPLEARLAEHRAEGRDFDVGSGGGRMWITMDRYQADWDMVARGWRCHVHGVGRGFWSASDAIRTLYADDPKVSDQWLPAFVIDRGTGPIGTVEDGDAVLFFNFRGDRAIEISRAFEDHDFPFFDRGRRPVVTYAGMMRYDGDLGVPRQFLVHPPAITNTVGELLVKAGMRTFACSETQKFGHVTYFFNGNRSGLIDPTLEKYMEVPSDRRPFDERPWMKAAEITDQCVEAIHSGEWDHVRLNYANGDMVGHTGDLTATRLAVEAVDLQVGRLWEAVKRADGILLVTADHGNADEKWMRDRKTGEILRDATGHPVIRPSHSLNPVPFILCDPRGELGLAEVPFPGIANIGPTVLVLLGVATPADYVPSLVVVQ